MPGPDSVLDFWFSDAVRPLWFARSEALDADVTRKFSETHAAARRGDLAPWQQSAEGALALTLVLDQFPRNMYRGTPGAFDSDDAARAVARVALEAGHDCAVSAEARPFFYLPFMHSEDLTDQQQAVALYEALDSGESLEFAYQHRDIIARFGRFPHRNAILGRESTAEELAFLKTHKGW